MKHIILISTMLLAMLFGCRQGTPTENSEETADPQEQEQEVELVTPENPEKGTMIVDDEKLKITASTPATPSSGGSEEVLEIRKHHQAGVQDLKQEKFEDAVEDFNKVLELDPDNHHAFYNRGFAYFHLEMYNEADEDFSRAIQYNPDDSTSHLYKGLIRYYEQDFNGAMKEYSEAIAVAPGYADAYYNRGIARGQLGMYPQARKDFDQAIKLNPNHRNAYFNRALANFFLGDTVSACRDWQESHALGSAKAMEAINAYCK